MKRILGKIIRSCRIYCGFTQEYVAHKLGVTTHTYANIEHGRVDISVNKLTKVSQLFGLKAHQILNLAEEELEYDDDSCTPDVIKGIIRLTSINPYICKGSLQTNKEGA